MSTNYIDPKMVGEVNEAAIEIECVPSTALLATGSCVSVVSETFYKEHLLNCKLNPIASIFKVECADGQALPYLGYIEA